MIPKLVIFIKCTLNMNFKSSILTQITLRNGYLICILHHQYLLPKLANESDDSNQCTYVQGTINTHSFLNNAHTACINNTNSQRKKTKIEMKWANFEGIKKQEERRITTKNAYQHRQDTEPHINDTKNINSRLGQSPDAVQFSMP